MRLLLDTHIFLWFVSGNPKLALDLREAIRDPQNEVFLSVASLWEIIIKFGQAIEHDLKLVTVDAAIRAYPTAPVL